MIIVNKISINNKTTIKNHKTQHKSQTKQILGFQFTFKNINILMSLDSAVCRDE